MMIHEKPTVFISFNRGSKDFVDCLEQRLSKEAKILRYEDEVPEWGSFVADTNCPLIYSVIEEICERVQISKKAVFSYITENGEPVNMCLLCVLEYIRENPSASISNIAEYVGILMASAVRCLKKLIELDRIR